MITDAAKQTLSLLIQQFQIDHHISDIDMLVLLGDELSQYVKLTKEQNHANTTTHYRAWPHGAGGKPVTHD